MIVETIFSTLNENDEPNFAPMGILWGEEFFTVRPFRNTRTCRNLLANGYGVANLTDDVLAFVQSGLYKMELPFFPAKKVPGAVFQRTCSWSEAEVVAHEVSTDRAEIRCRVLHREQQKDFLGFCRARNAIIEATILATRLALYSPETVSGKLAAYKEIVEKTGADEERQAFRLVQDFVRKGEK